MPNFVDDLLDLPFPKFDDRPLGSADPDTHVVAEEWGEVCQAALDLREKVIDLLDQWTPGTGTVGTLLDVGIGTTDPEAALHLRSEDMIGLRVQRDGIAGVGSGENPWFEIGRVQLAGVDLPEVQIIYGDSDTPSGRKIYGMESSGTMATVANNLRGSAYEQFLQDGSYHPWFRMNAYPDGRLTIGPGGVKVAPGGVVRSGSTVTVTCASDHNFRDGASCKMYAWGGTDPKFPDSHTEADFTITRVSSTVFTYTKAGTAGSNTYPLVYSHDVDVAFGREAGYSNLLAELGHTFRVGGGDKFYVRPNDVLLPAGIPLLGITETVVGVDGGAKLKLRAAEAEVLPSLWARGGYRCGFWYNGGGETQTDQECFIVGTGSGAKTTYLGDASDGTRRFVRNYGVNNLTVDPNPSPVTGKTIDGAATYVLGANVAACFLKVSSTEWLRVV